MLYVHKIRCFGLEMESLEDVSFGNTKLCSFFEST